MNRLKRFRGRMSRPFPHEVPTVAVGRPGTNDGGPLTKYDLPTTSYVERLKIDGEETAFTGVGNAAVEVLLSALYEARNSTWCSR
ncbi:hypothetical protein PC116_g19938 [Phytophthora cactorum]|uniref:Uncharacterized protein n=1 Tax=Phytophthora cactorum TaxID=29920 RepID=A0A329SCB7_9STRA|nr:hypothetical protein PC116_g19938 [Phytophthora cactorum]RAW34310.1 hypothetical protein PC110_g9385 [Phytophthora cactorum]